MSQEKYIGMDVHQTTISVAVINAQGQLLMECVLETKAATILEFMQGLRGTLALTFEEGTSAAWLHDLLQPHVSRLVVCDPRKNAVQKCGPIGQHTSWSFAGFLSGSGGEWDAPNHGSSHPGTKYCRHHFNPCGRKE